MQLAEPERLITISEAARRLRVTSREIHTMVRRGHLRVVHLNGTKVREASLNAYIKSLERDPFARQVM